MSATSRSITELLSNQGRIAGNAERERAGIAAQAQRERGQIFGSTIAQIGQQIGNLPKEINQAKTLQLETQTKQMQFDLMKRAQVGQAQANQVIAQMPRNEDGTYDTGALIQGLSQRNVPLPVLEQLAKSIDGVNGVISSFNTAKNEHIADLANTILANHQKGEPVTADAVHLGIAAARAAGLATASDEQKLTQAIATGADPESVLKSLRGISSKYKDANKPVSVAAGASLVNPSTGEAVFKAPDRPVSVAPGASLVEPSTGKVSYTAPESAAQKLSAANIEADNKRADAALELSRAHLALSQQHERREAAQNDATPVLTPEGIDAVALNFAKTGQLPPMGMGRTATALRTQIINRAAQMNPSLDLASNRAEFGANEGALKQLQKQRDAIGAFEQTAQKNIDVFLAQAGKVVDLGSPIANTAARYVTGKMLGSPDQAAYDAARQVAINEIAKITSNPTLTGQLSDTARKEVEAFNPNSATLKQSVAVMRLLKTDMDNRTSSLDQQIKAIKGRIGGKTELPAGAEVWTRDASGKLVPPKK